MPAPVRDIHVAVHPAARDIPQAVWAAWQRNETQANIMLPHALAAIQRELKGAPPTPGQFWLSLSSMHAAADGTLAPVVEMVLSCTEWAMGTYPIFVFCNPAVLDALSAVALNARLSMLVAELHARVPVSRVYSVFAPTRVTKAFARLWINMTGAQIEREPYYSAVFSFCTAQTITRRRQTLVADRIYTLRLAHEADIPAVARLCKGFASTSDPFILSDEGALKEASYLVRNGLVYLHEVEVGHVTQVASIVATTRQSENVSGITKVYTSPDVRKQGCAERLVRHVCQHLLLRERKHAVVLYVAHNNPAAAKVYHRVGFQGLSPSADAPRPAGVEDWLELGFRDAALGHW
ncbi:hypothetical protein AURDEDRAFT_188728 [Auricularia subglabra TFB-10046 SS5]|uniref:N-acetyltransferase domain-containing protein n=1 Tax=Auricularia subglabra (strain TFB-10046 / SS5) TaxID=717982 RepID=J0WTA7_AURST|nr:hypothetical protein AURDEDRAFT_188728 [Auricularia subglabra TFB-10046 SS5]